MSDPLLKNFSTLPLHLAALPTAEVPDNTRRLGLRQPSEEGRRRQFAVMLDRYLGKLPDPFDIGVTDFSIEQPDIDGQMLWNDQLGCCGISAAYRSIMLIVFLQTGKVVLPSQKEFNDFYHVVGGYVPGKAWTDNGVDNPTLVRDMQTIGLTLAGQVHKCGPVAVCQGDDAVTVRKAIYYLLATIHGIDLPQEWYNNYGPGHVWDATSSRIVGGHDVDACGFNKIGPKIVTWGKATQCTWAGWAQRCTDCNGIADPNDTIDPKTGLSVMTGIPMAEWAADVQALTGAIPVMPPIVVPPIPEPDPGPPPPASGMVPMATVEVEMNQCLANIKAKEQ
jgi:hypothetical protein